MADPISQQGLYQDGNSIFENVHILGTLEVTGIVNTETTIKASKFIGDGSELSGIDATTIKDSTGTTQIQGTTTGATHSGRAVFDELEVQNKLYDGDGNFGTSGQLLSSDGTDTIWIDASSTSVANANNVGVNANSTDADQFITFVESTSGNNPIRVDSDLKYNPFTNTIATIRINDLQVVGQLKDGDNNFGASGTVLTSDGTDTAWANVGTLAAGSAAKLSVTEDDTETDGRLLFSNAAGQTGGNEVKSDDQLTYNASTNVLTGGTFAGNISGGDGVFNDLTVNGELKDGDGNFGSSGQVLTSDGTDTKWDNASALTAGVSSKVTLTATNTTDSTHFPVFVDTATGDEDVRTDSGFTYNPSSGTLTATTFSGAFSLSSGTGAISNPARLASNVVAAGRLQANSVVSGNIVDNAVTFAKLQDVPQSHLIGRIASGSGDATHLNMSQVKSMLGTITNATNAANVTLTPDNNDTNFHCLFSMSSFQSSAQNASVLFDSGSYTYNPNDNRLNLSKLQVHQISPTGTYDAGSSNQVLIATGGTPGLDWGPTISSVASNSTIVQRHSSGYIFANYFNTTPNDVSSGVTKVCVETGNDGYIRHGDTAAIQTFINANVSASNNTIVKRHSSGYIFANFFNTTPNDVSSGITKVCVETGDDGYIRHGTAAGVRSFLNVADGANNITNNNQLSNGAGYITATDVRSMNEAASTGQSSTTSNTAVDKVTLSINTVSNSRVMILYGFDIKHSDTSNKSCIASVTGTNVALIGGGRSESNKNTAYQRFHGNILDISSHTGTRTYRITFRRSTSGGSASIQNAYLTAIEMSV